MSAKPTPDHDSPRKNGHGSAPSRHWLLQLVLWLAGLAVAALLSIVFVAGVAMVVAYPNLPDISDLADYRPKLPLRIFTADGVLMGEFGEERRNLTPINEIPKVMKDAVLSIEDARFYQHGGVDYLGILRAGVANIGRMKSQGASTITMQVARNVYLSSEKTYTRKIYEILLTYKLEHMLSKDQILEIYMNQIFLGNRAYGFAAASETYFGKPLKDITVAEAAMLAGLPKNPSFANPITHLERATARQRRLVERRAQQRHLREVVEVPGLERGVLSVVGKAEQLLRLALELRARVDADRLDLVAQGVSKDSQGQSRNGDHEAWESQQGWHVVHLLEAVGQRRTPAWLLGIAKTKE